MKSLLFTALLLSILGLASAQKVYTYKDIVPIKTIMFYGIDFSNAEIIFESPRHQKIIKHRLYDDFNDEFLTDKSDKLKKCLDKQVIYQEDIQKQRESLKDTLLKMADSSDYQKVVKKYQLTEKEGIGLVFIVKCLDKRHQRVELCPVFFDIASKNVLWIRKTIGKGRNGPLEDRDPSGLDYYWRIRIFHGINKFMKNYSDVIQIQ
jgi:hypothetical protein